MDANIEGAVSKLSRAYRHLDELSREVWALYPEMETPLRMEVTPGGLEYSFFVGELPPIPADWALVVSEILFNVRSALDYLTFELHSRRFRGRVPRKAAKNSQFPIFSAETDLSKHRYTENLSMRDQAALRQLQPFLRRSDGWKYVRQRLALLSSVQNSDKHRSLQILAATVGAYGTPDLPDWCRFHNFMPSDPLVSNSCVQRWTFEREPLGLRLDHTAIISIAVRSDSTEFHMVNGLGEIINAATFVLERFADRFPAVPRPQYWRHPMWQDPPLPEGAARPRRRSLF